MLYPRNFSHNAPVLLSWGDLDSHGMFYAVYGDHLFILRYFSFKETFLSVTLGRGFFPLARLKMSVPLVLSPFLWKNRLWKLSSTNGLSISIYITCFLFLCSRRSWQLGDTVFEIQHHYLLALENFGAMRTKGKRLNVYIFFSSECILSTLS